MGGWYYCIITACGGPAHPSRSPTGAAASRTASARDGRGGAHHRRHGLRAGHPDRRPRVAGPRAGGRLRARRRRRFPRPPACPGVRGGGGAAGRCPTYPPTPLWSMPDSLTGSVPGSRPLAYLSGPPLGGGASIVTLPYRQPSIPHRSRAEPVGQFQRQHPQLAKEPSFPKETQIFGHTETEIFGSKYLGTCKPARGHRPQERTHLNVSAWGVVGLLAVEGAQLQFFLHFFVFLDFGQNLQVILTIFLQFFLRHAFEGPYCVSPPGTAQQSVPWCCSSGLSRRKALSLSPQAVVT